MGVSLTKGGNVSLTKEAPGLTAVTVGLGWDVRTTTGTDFDLDASAPSLCDADGKVVSDADFIFFNNQESRDGSVEHTGDNLTGEGEGDDEQIKVNLASVPADVDKIVFPVSIYDAEHAPAVLRPGAQRLHPRASTRPTASELARYDLSEDASTETAMVFGELYRNGAEWKFRAVGQGYASGLARHRAGLRRQRLSSGRSLAAAGRPNPTERSHPPRVGAVRRVRWAWSSIVLRQQAGTVREDRGSPAETMCRSLSPSSEDEGDDETVKVMLAAVPRTWRRPCSRPDPRRAPT